MTEQDVSAFDGAITPERVRELLDYNPDTGDLVWRASGIGRRLDKPAGSLNGRGYRTIMLDRRSYLAHRLAWLHFYGEWPSGGLDHLDCNCANSAIRNLRLATQSQNRANKRRAQNNTSGYKGVSAFRKQWKACIRRGGKQHYLGIFPSAADAHAAYCAKAEELFGEFWRAA